MSMAAVRSRPVADKPTISRAAYDAAWELERMSEYPEIDAIEFQRGYRVERPRLELAARALACPVKVNPPNWQHGRVIYAVLRSMLERHGIDDKVVCLDVGTAKGFSALCAQWAINDSERRGVVISLDVIDPLARVRRNTVSEVDGYETLAETLAPWSEARAITFLCGTGVNWLALYRKRVHFAFLDGKHRRDVVEQELSLLRDCQAPGDVVICDDLQIPGVAAAVDKEHDRGFYDFHEVRVCDLRSHAIGLRL